MTAEIITLGRAVPAAPSPHVQHYTDQAKLAWFDRMARCIENGERIFRQPSDPMDEIAWLEEAREVLAGIEHL